MRYNRQANNGAPIKAVTTLMGSSAMVNARAAVSASSRNMPPGRTATGNISSWLGPTRVRAMFLHLFYPPAFATLGFISFDSAVSTLRG